MCPGQSFFGPIESRPGTKHESRVSSGCGWAAKLDVPTRANARYGEAARSLLDRAFRGFENPLPRTDARCGEEVRGWHSSTRVRVYPTLYGPIKQLAEKLRFLKGTAFRSYVNVLQ